MGRCVMEYPADAIGAVGLAGKAVFGADVSSLAGGCTYKGA